MSRVLVTGGVRSGKSRHAENLVKGFRNVIYATPGYPADPQADHEWAARVAAHRAVRPASWLTVETTDLTGLLRDADAPVLVDCLGVWLTRQLDEWEAWDQPAAQVARRAAATVADLAAAVANCPQPLVVVTNEVGWGLVPLHASGRLFADLLGRANQTVASVCDEVHLVVAGRVLVLPDAAGARV